jgi:hypothetical protein
MNELTQRQQNALVVPLCHSTNTMNTVALIYNSPPLDMDKKQVNKPNVELLTSSCFFEHKEVYAPSILSASWTHMQPGPL